ncbi:lysine--tRNA ligase [Candidatus Falkowbacteria bacterium RIFOXYD2_FULL_35_9]|uniref:Lysine--tRNA ligase n=1 Tax=Candidatus Falkowbacteria bacterium RIFOXYC2_FULL_36_12 TaxID=1798002 RepID=A0A1F5SY99_9BACT|nr:MAG: lysine--tRNA ligase [Candidatus Falkowbacteria bacterium RIFOXYB2_FULL_35_7]OGF31619.1 MAG: lysine--tRNA ligase [Candidatus Falkowbacteria bacterium RIFOXYC2_FULL_36_12]OGF33915.1 MAG: lysine--tRNA ligase [Candidatus Falkowbacteria bacterium RIFOXYA2_FULL_35_8]OGF46888.1 MAG: lysine--tRNA ligase [Candidatus Falkowbacteria bacterium RIFOXYD2_FULL_35_9]
MSDQNEQQIRQNKLDNLIKAGMHPYPEKFDKQYDLSACPELKEGISLSTAGRLIMFRDMGKITFAHLQDSSGKFQVVFKKDVVGDNEYKLFIKNIDLGDHIGIEGEIFTTQKGEISILVRKWTFLGKALLPLPEKWHGLKDREIAYRQRYLDLISNQETMKRFEFRSDFIRTLREFYWLKGFYEVETPTLLHSATGAHATPYKTHNNALDIDVFLRISHELPLKELIVGGFDKVFEIGKAFRNEGHDPSHLPEHTHLEHYCAYWNYEDNMKFTEEMIEYVFDKLKISRQLTIKDRDGQEKIVDFTTPFERINFIELIKKDTGIDITKVRDTEKLLKKIQDKKIVIDGMEDMGYASLVDNLYKKVSRPKMVGPAFLYFYPIELQPLARRNDKDKNIVDQFQLVINGWEIIKAYSELVDPLDQEQRFKQQAELKQSGDNETMEGDPDYITAMKYGMPPISGWGMGVDRMITILTGQENLRDTVLFPLMRSSSEDQK